ncbi:MAG: type I-A CRISPR-associated protein Cas7/Csa2 [Desulfurococcaceae archaeon]
MVYVRVTGRCLINIHTANAEGAVGNYMALSKMFIVRRTDKGYEVQEEPVISGNMIKHWHAVATTEILRSWGYNAICDNCRRHVMYRSVLKLSNEYEYLQKCAIEDLHGFLDTDTQIRRESIVKFSFMIPVEEQRSEFSPITHNRVVIREEGKIDEQAMMVMKREHASGIYGFLCSMDLAFAGVSLANPDKKLQQHDRKIRARAAVAALMDLFSGHFGAAQSRAIPIIKTLELICIASRRPIPNAVHGFYMDYAEETAGIVKATINQGLVNQDEIKVVVVGRPASIFKAEQILIDEVKTVSEAVTKILEASDRWL